MSTITAPSMHDPDRPTLGLLTGLHLNRGEDWKVATDAVRRRRDLGQDTHCTPDSENQATLRRIGWIDQKGRIWLETPAAKDFDGGSLSPLLIDTRD